MQMQAGAKRNYFILAILVFLLTIPVVPFLLFKYGVESVPELPKPLTFEIKEGQSVEKIAQNLASAGLIDSPLLFRAYLKIYGLDKSIQAGAYEISDGLSIIQLANLIQKGKSDLALTFIEGWRAEEIAAYASEQLENVDYQEFMTYVKENELEGYLFPDTYYVNKEINSIALVELLRTTFKEKTSELFNAQALNQRGLTASDAAVFASIVEREANTDEDRPIVAGILVNRWKSGMRLDADATTQYAVGTETDWWPKELTFSDLQSDSPFNTRKNIGLPPSPISSYGISALQAVVNYTDTSYTYYLTDPDGVTHYAATLDEHEQNISKYLN